MTVATIGEILDGVIESTDDPEGRYKLRNARQLLDVVQQRHEHVDEALADADVDADVVTNLRDLGYVE
jgi:hypothetical protein